MASEVSMSDGDSKALFTTDIVNDVVKLKNVILNEFHVLRKFSFISLCNETLCVKLESDLGSQIGFQIDNENFDHENIAEQTVATFLADDFNQLFNTVNLVTEVILQPRQVQQVILTFRPSEPLDGSSKEKDEKDNKQIAGQNASRVSLKRLSANVTEIFQVNGKLSFTATIIGDGVETRHGEATRISHQNITVQFNSSVCRSVLKTDVSEIVFEDCVPGGVFVKDFSVWNLSEIPGSFELNVKCGSPEKPGLELTDYDTGLPISRGDIKSFSHRRIRVTYKPKDVGDFTYIVHLQNNFDERNSKSVPFRCIVNPEQRQEGLLVTGVGEDGILDFGDCYSGNGTCQLLTLRNVTQEALVVNLSSDHSSGDKVTFYRQTELDLLSATSKARLKDVVNPVEDDVVSLEGAHKETLVLDKLDSPAGPSVIVNKKSKVDLITLGKGEEKNLLVWFFPAGASDELKAARLQRRNFRLSLKCAEKKGYSKQRFSKIIQCKAQICTSIVKLSTQELNFGDCNVGSTKASSVQIHNLSDLSALITPYVTSTILSIKSQAERVSIPARQTHSLDIDLVPLKINHKYRKQIRVDNLLNKENNQVLEVRAKIMDRHHVLFHSVYYKLQTPSASNVLIFDSAVVNNPCVKILTVENITDKELILDFNTNMPEELGIYTLQDSSSSEYGDLGVGDVCSLSSEASEEDIYENRKRAYAASVNKEKILETLEESQPRLSKAIVNSAPFPLQQGHSKTAPPTSPLSSSEKKPRMRMSLDLSASPLSASLSGLPSLETGPLTISAITDDSTNEVAADVKSFEDTNQNVKPGTLKRVQSDAMLSAAEEASKVLGSSRRSSDDDYLDEVLTRLGCATALNCSFTDEDAVKKFIDNHIRDRELTMHALEDVPHTLLPLGKLELLPGESRNLYVILVTNGQFHTDLQGRLQKLEAKVTIQMIEYDKERQEHLEPGFLEPTVDDDLLTREIPVEINVCRAVLSLAQKNISFGKLLTNEHRAKTLVLNNVSDVPLLYKIKKTGSIASGDLHIIDGRSGVLQPHSSQEVNFVFQPSLSGSFHETLIVSNVYDPNNDQVVNLKATISRAETFRLKSNSIDFAAVISGQWSSSQSFLFSNTSKQSRTFILREIDCGGEGKGPPTPGPATANLQPTCAYPALIKLRFALEPKRHTVQSHARPEQEAIEALERKALAYERKGKGDKVAKIRKDIKELRVKLTGNGNNDKQEEMVVGEAMDLVSETKGKQTPLNFASVDVPAGAEKEKDLISKNSDGFISFTLKPSESQVVLVSCYAWMPDSTPLGEQIKGAFLAYESKNQDVVKRVEFEATVCSDNTYLDDHALSSMKQSNRTGEDSPSSIPSLSPTVTPDSSVPTSPGGGQTPQMLSGHQASRKLSASSWFASIEPVDLNFDGDVSASAAPSCKPLLDAEQPQTVIGLSNPEICFPFSVGEAVKMGNGDILTGGSLSSPKALFKVDLLQLGKPELVSKEDQRIHEVKQAFLSVAQSKTSEDKEVIDEVVLEDHSGGDMMEASYLLRSLCSNDVWIYFVLDWPEARDLQLWVSDLGLDHVSNICKGIAESALSGARAERGSGSGPGSPCEAVQLQWQQLESQALEKGLADKPKLMTSLCLKGGAGQWITFRMLDEGSRMYINPVRKDANALSLESSTMVNYGIFGRGLGMGTLTMQALPNGASIQLLLRARQLERYLKVTPTDVIFPESDLTTVLMKEITILNRSRFEVDFETKVSGGSKLLDKSSEMLRFGKTGTSAALPSAGEIQSFSLVEPVVSVTPALGRIEGNGSLTAKIVCQPVKSGKQGYTIYLRSSLCMSESKVNIAMAPRKVHRLRLPDVPTGCVLDMGYCFINASEGAKVVPLRLESLFAKPLSLAFRSNLTKQVYISRNPTGDSRTDEMQIQGAGSETVYLCLRPGGDASAYKGGRCREVIGGMRISVKSIDTGMNSTDSQEDFQDEIMVKFRAMVGQSLLQVSTSLVDLGRLEVVGGFISGFFVVSNPSSQMPLDFTISAGRASLSVVRGRLLGKEATASTGNQEKSETAIEYCLPVTEYGLIEDRVVVQNLSCPGQSAEVLLRVYVDRGSLKSHIQPPVRHFPYFGPEMSNVLSNEDLPSNDPYKLPLLSSTNFYGANFSLLSNQTAIGTSTVDLEKTLNLEGLSPRRTYSLPATNLELDDFQDRAISDAGRIVGPLQDNHLLDMGIVYIFLGSGGIEVENGNPAEREMTDSAGYSVSDVCSFQSSLLLANSSDKALTLQPVSTLPLRVFAEKHGVSQLSDKSVAMVDTKSRQTTCTAISGITTQSTKEAPGGAFAWNLCGNKFRILPGSEARLLVGCDNIQPSSSMDVSHMQKGQLCAFEGLLAFCKSNDAEDSENFEFNATAVQDQWDLSQFLELLSVKGFMCVSYGEVETKEINLGKVGDANGWQDLDFDIEVHNGSDAEMVFQVTDAPDIFSFSYLGLELRAGVNGFTVCQLPARGTNSIQVILHTSKLEHRKEARTWSWKLCLVNCNNRKNIMEVSVVAEMTVRNLRFVGLTESTLVLPPLTVPLQPQALPCSSRFSVENLSTGPIGVALELHQVEDTESLVMLEVTSKASTSSITELTLQPGESVELQVGARLVSDFIPHALRGDDGERHSSGFTISPRSALENDDKSFMTSSTNIERQGSLEKSWVAVSNSDQSSFNASRLANEKNNIDITGFREDSAFSSEENLSETTTMVCLGHLYLYSSPLPDCIDIFGTLIPGPMFGVSPSSLQCQAKLSERDTLSDADDVRNGIDAIRFNSSSKVESDFTSMRLESWEGWHDKSNFLQKIVIQNYLAFDQLQLKVWAQQTLSDDFGTQLRFLEVHPVETLVPPGGSTDIIVRFLSWSGEMYEAFLRQVSEGLGTAEYLMAAVFIQDFEERDNRQKVDVCISPPTVLQNSPSDAAGLASQTQNCSSSNASEIVSKDLVKNVNPSKQRLPVLGLRGCTAVSGSPVCYEFNLGQQNISSGGHRHWNLTLVGDQERPISYRLRTISDADASWLSISSSAGVVEALQQNTVKLSFSTKAMGVYSTYLVVENFDNPADLKTVHLSMEVVALKNSRPEAPLVPFFYILVQGDRAEGAAIDMGEIYYNFWYRNRSFVIVNEASVAMEFLLSSTLDHNDPTELNFSLENTSLKRFSSVIVDAKSSIRLWIHFCIAPPKEEPLTEDTCDEFSATIFVNCRLVKDYQRCIPFRAKCRYPQIGISSTDVLFSTRRHGSGYTFTDVTSDAGVCSTANGECRNTDAPVNSPFIGNEVLLGSTGIQHLRNASSESHSETSGTDNETPVESEVLYDVLRSSQQSDPALRAHRDDDLDLMPSFQILTLSNLYLHRKLEYVVKNDSLFFKVDVPESQEIPSVVSQGLHLDVHTLSTKMHEKACHDIVVRPNLDTLRENRKMVMKQKYIEEHLTVYNRSNPHEKYTVSLRLTAGHLRNFFAASGPNKSYTFERLELAITSFLSTFYSSMNQLLMGLHEKSTMGSRLDLQMSAHRKDFAVPKSASSKETGLASGKLMKQGSWNMQNQDVFQEFEKCLESFSSRGEGSQQHDVLFFDLQYLTDELVFYSLKERWSKGGVTLELSTVKLAKLLYCALYRCQIFQLCLESCQSFTALATQVGAQVTIDGELDMTRASSGQTLASSGSRNEGQNQHPLGKLVPIPPLHCFKFIERWTGQLRHFLSFFPDTRDDISSLRDLNQQLQEILVSCRIAFDQYS